MLNKVTTEDILLCFEMSNLFMGSSDKQGQACPMNAMNFDSFKKIFFPHLYVVAQDPGSDDERQARKTKIELEVNKEK